MSPLRPAPSRLLSQARSVQDGDDSQIQQAGRSATNLHAQVSAASIREAGHPQPRTLDHHHGMHGESRPHSPAHDERETPASSRFSSPLLASGPYTHHAPAAHAALPGSSTARSNSRSSSSYGSLEMVRSREADAAGIAFNAGLAPPPTIPAAARPSMLTPYGSTTSLSKMSTPRSVRDLGQDYSRYYNPFATRNNSSTDLSTPLPQYHTPASGDETKRFSDPFDDNKQVHGASSIRPKYAAAGVAAGVGAGAAASAAASPAMSSRPLLGADEPESPFFPVYLDDRLGAPGNQGYDFPLYWDEKEADDDMHLPMLDDDVKLRPTLKDHFTKETVVTTLGLILMILGLLTLFIVLPVLSATGLDILGSAYETPLDQMWGSGVGDDEIEPWALINASRTWPNLKNIRTGLIDPDTPKSALTRTAVDGSKMKLVFSDEFNDANRTFYQGDDPYWFAPDIWYGATMDLEWYDPDAVTTWDGSLELRLDAFGNHNLQFRSGMLNSWNQLCFKGGVYEVSVSLPGPGGIHALWPGVWSMGNLGRPGYLATTDGMWPYTYNDCDAGITPNQSSTDGISRLPGQRLTSCGCAGEDHPTPGKGRGAPEIDIIEVSGDWGGLGVAVATQSYQVAPFDIWYYPDYEFMEIPDYSVSFVNTYTGGPFQQAVSTTTMLNNSWYDGEIYQKYAYEYTPGITADAEILWWVGDEMTMRFDARALGPNGNVGQRIISEEPMSMILNLGISNNWVNIDWAALKFPAVMRVDYVRWYQKEGEESVTCDPPGYETTEYIKNHPEAYNNPNYTHWTDIPGYTWPKNKLMHQC